MSNLKDTMLHFPMVGANCDVKTVHLTEALDGYIIYSQICYNVLCSSQPPSTFFHTFKACCQSIIAKVPEDFSC